MVTHNAVYDSIFQCFEIKDQFHIPGFILHKATTMVKVSCVIVTGHLFGILFLYCHLKSIKLLISEKGRAHKSL